MSVHSISIDVRSGYHDRCIPCRGEGGGWLNGLKLDFNLSRSYHRLQLGFGGVCRCMRVNLDQSCLGRMIYACQFLGTKPLTQIRHRWAERNHSDHYTDFEQPNSLAPSTKPEAQTSQFVHLWCDVVGDRTHPPAPQADPLTTISPGDLGKHPKQIAIVMCHIPNESLWAPL